MTPEVTSRLAAVLANTAGGRSGKPATSGNTCSFSVHASTVAISAQVVKVRHGSFDDIPARDAGFDVVWSQDAILHAPDRRKVLMEAFRVLKPGGELIFTDPMQNDDVVDGALQPVYDRLNLTDLASPRFYREAAQAVGFEVVEQFDDIADLRTHYLRVGEELEAQRAALAGRTSAEYLDTMAAGLREWVRAADRGDLAYGIQRFRKPAA